MTAPAGAEVGLYVDLDALVSIGDVIETRGSGRRYFVVRVRVQARGKHAGRQHLRVVVMAADDPPVANGGSITHLIRWYKRKRKC